MLLARNLMSPGNLAFSAASTMPRYSFPDPGQATASGQKSSSGELTTAGKVLKWVGIGLMGAGGAEVAVGATAFKDSCYGSGIYSACTDYSPTRRIYYVSGAATAGIGAVLFLVGIHKKQ
jgi:hypothetical protein